jgi:hypothetical protein
VKVNPTAAWGSQSLKAIMIGLSWMGGDRQAATNVGATSRGTLKPVHVTDLVIGIVDGLTVRPER